MKYIIFGGIIFMKIAFFNLDDNEKTLIEMRYFQDKTQFEVAKTLGISQVQVSRMEKKILLSMRKNMEV